MALRHHVVAAKAKVKAGAAKKRKTRVDGSLDRLLASFPASVQRQCQAAEEACDKNDMGVVIRNLDHFIFHSDLVLKATCVLKETVLPPLWHRPAQVALAKALDRYSTVEAVVCNALQALCNIAVQDPAFECQTIRAMLKVADQNSQSGAPIILFLELASALITPTSPAPKLRYSLITNQTELAQAGCIELCLNIIARRLKSGTSFNLLHKKKTAVTANSFKTRLHSRPERLRNEQIKSGIIQLALHVLYLLSRENISCLRALCLSTAWQSDWRTRKNVKNLPKKITQNQVLIAKESSIDHTDMFRKLLINDMTRTNPQLAVAAVRLLTVIAERCSSLDWKLVTQEVVNLLGRYSSILDFAITAVEALEVLKAGQLIPPFTYTIAHQTLGEKHAHSEFSVVTPRLEAHRMHLRNLLASMMAPISLAPPAQPPDDQEPEANTAENARIAGSEGTTGAKKEYEMHSDDGEDSSSDASSKKGCVTSPANLARKMLCKAQMWKATLGSEALTERLVEDLTPAITRFLQPMRTFTENILVSAQLGDNNIGFTAKLCTKAVCDALYPRMRMFEQTLGREKLSAALARTMKKRHYRLPPLGLAVNIRVKEPPLPEIQQDESNPRDESINLTASASGSKNSKDAVESDR